MLSPNWSRVLHAHIPKCGGTTLNNWLNLHTVDDRISDVVMLQASIRSLGRSLIMRGQPTERSALIRKVAGTMAFHMADVVHGHAVLLPFAPPGTFRMTVLRDPMARLVSKVNDWRRLAAHDVTAYAEDFQTLVADTRRLNLAGFLQRHARGAHRGYFDNGIARILAANRMDARVALTIPADQLLAPAMQSLEEDFELVGLTESLDLTRNAAAALLGLAPVGNVVRMNESGSGSVMEQEGAEAEELLRDLTRTDQILFARAREIFDERHRAQAVAYTDEVFESQHAAAVTGKMRGKFVGGAMVYSVHDPLVGRGFHNRDGAGLPACAVWSGPDPRLVVYMPVIQGHPVSLMLWIRGYVQPEQRNQLRVLVDGVPTPHGFESANGYADVLICNATSSRGFVRLEVDVGQTTTSGEAGTPSFDARKRGLAFDAYGWRWRPENM